LPFPVCAGGFSAIGSSAVESGWQPSFKGFCLPSKPSSGASGDCLDGQTVNAVFEFVLDWSMN